VAGRFVAALRAHDTYRVWVRADLFLAGMLGPPAFLVELQQDTRRFDVRVESCDVSVDDLHGF